MPAALRTHGHGLVGKALLSMVTVAFLVISLLGCDTTEDGVNNGIISGLLVGAGVFVLTQQGGGGAALTSGGTATTTPVVVRLPDASGIGLGIDPGSGTGTGTTGEAVTTFPGIDQDYYSSRFPSVLPYPEAYAEGQKVLEIASFNPSAYHRPLSLSIKDGSAQGTAKKNYTIFFVGIRNVSGVREKSDFEQASTTAGTTVRVEGSGNDATKTFIQSAQSSDTFVFASTDTAAVFTIKDGAGTALTELTSKAPGTYASSIGAGTYRVDVTSTASWTLDITGSVASSTATETLKVPGLDVNNVLFYVDYFDFKGTKLFADIWTVDYSAPCWYPTSKLQYPTVNDITGSQYNDPNDKTMFPIMPYYILRPFDERIYTARITRLGIGYNDAIWFNDEHHFINVEQFNRTVKGLLQKFEYSPSVAATKLFGEGTLSPGSIRIVARFVDKYDNIQDIQVSDIVSFDKEKDPELGHSNVARFQLTSYVDFEKFYLNWFWDTGSK